MTNKPFPRNPYIIGVPLTGDIGFYGRKSVFTFVENILTEVTPIVKATDREL